MATKWMEASVAELQAAGALLVEDGNHGEYRPLPDEFSDEGIHFIRAADMDGGRVLFESAQRINEVARQRIRKGIGAGGDVLLSHKGTVGKVAYVPQDAPPFICSPQTTFWRVKDPQQLDRRYIYFYLLSRAFREQLDSRKGETDMADYVSLTTQRTLKVTVPPITEQRAIVSVLGTLDDKIDLNRRMNVTLESMARALFQSWFVDFDPVRAKLDGRSPPALDQATAALFPASFDKTVLGYIPHGWEVKTLGEVIELAYGKPLKAEDRKDGPICVYGANGPIGWHDEKLVTGPGIVVGRKGNPGVVTWAYGDFYPIDTTFYVKPTGPCRSLYFFYYALSLHNLANLSADSAVPGLNRNHVYMSKQVIPAQPVLTAFDSQIAPIFAAIYANEEQSRRLGAARDTLLPQLLSGNLNASQLPSAE